MDVINKQVADALVPTKRYLVGIQELHVRYVVVDSIDEEEAKEAALIKAESNFNGYGDLEYDKTYDRDTWTVEDVSDEGI